MTHNYTRAINQIMKQFIQRAFISMTIEARSFLCKTNLRSGVLFFMQNIFIVPVMQHGCRANSLLQKKLSHRTRYKVICIYKASTINIVSSSHLSIHSIQIFFRWPAHWIYLRVYPLSIVHPREGSGNSERGLLFWISSCVGCISWNFLLN